MEFHILGSLEVLDTAGPVAIRGTKRRGLLTYLLVQRERMIPAARIADVLWSEHLETSGPSPARSFTCQILQRGDCLRRTHVGRQPLGHVARARVESVVGEGTPHRGGELLR